MTREPRSVRINNERQLDNRALISMHLFVLTLNKIEGGAVTLPGRVDTLRGKLVGAPLSASKFEHCLISAGYLDRHSNNYESHYAIKKQELFNVQEGFPRIIEVPQGVGNLKYSVFLSACKEHLVNLQTFLKFLTEMQND